MSIDKPTRFLKRCFGSSLSELYLTQTFAIICGCFYWASSEYWEVKIINWWGCTEFRHCEGKQSREPTRCTYQGKLNQL